MTAPLLDVPRDVLAARAGTDNDALLEYLRPSILPVTTWGWDVCIYCGEPSVDRSLVIVLGPAKGEQRLGRIGWCRDAECQADRQECAHRIDMPCRCGGSGEVPARGHEGADHTRPEFETRPCPDCPAGDG